MWSRMVAFWLRLIRWGFQTLEERRSTAQAGQSMVEYSIVAALIAVVAMAAVQALGGGIATVFGRILTSISGIGG